MKATFNRSSLIAALKKVSPCCGSKQFSILTSCLINVQDSVATITGTNLSTTIQTHATVESKENGVFLIDAKRILDLLAAQVDESITLNVEGSFVKISSGKFKATLPTQDITEYPPINMPEINGVKVGGDELRAAIRKVLTSVASDQTRPEFTGVWIVVDKSSMTLVTTDGHRLAKCVIQADNNGKTQLDDGAIIDAAGIKAIMGCLDSDAVSMDIVKGKLAVSKSNGDIFTASIISGTFPDFSRVFPQSTPCTLRVDRVSLSKAIKSLSLFSPKTDTIKIDAAKGQIFLTTYSDAGEAIQGVDAEVTGKLENRVGLSWRYLMDACNVLDESMVSIGLCDCDSPLLVTDVGSKRNSFLIMPMKD